MPLESHSLCLFKACSLYLLASAAYMEFIVCWGWCCLPRPRSFRRVNCYTLSYLRLGASEFHLCLSVQLLDFFWLLLSSSFKARRFIFFFSVAQTDATTIRMHLSAVRWYYTPISLSPSTLPGIIILLYLILHSARATHPVHCADTGSPHLLSNLNKDYTAAGISRTSRISYRQRQE